MIELSMSMLDTFQRCRRRWMYRYVMGLQPKGRPDYMDIGSGFHAGVAQGYREYASREHFVEIAQRGFQAWLLTEDAQGFDMTNAPLVEDMIAYWWEHEGKLQDYCEIVSVEEHIPLLDFRGFAIRCTPDVLARRAGSGRLVLTDHKTVGTIGDSLAFLPLDFQLQLYALSCWERYDEIPEIDYNLVRRELPPDFMRADGTMPYALTATGRKSTRSCDPADYCRRERQLFTPKKLEAFRAELNDLVQDLEAAIETQRYPRSIIKNGATACGGCPYLAACKREFGGDSLDGITLSLEFQREPSILEAA